MAIAKCNFATLPAVRYRSNHWFALPRTRRKPALAIRGGHSHAVFPNSGVYMKLSSKALICLWTGEISACVQILRDQALHDVDGEQLTCLNSLLSSISCNVSAINVLVADLKDVT
jgi:hypothetical protein